MKFLWFLFVLATLISCKGKSIEKPILFGFIQPSNFPPTKYNFTNNPVTKDGFLLGRALFYDGILSKDGSVSCGSCHQQMGAFANPDHDLSHGIQDRLTSRNSPPIINAAWQTSFFWDGGVVDLDLFAINPIENHNEMDEFLPNVLNKLRLSSKYPPLFQKAFGTFDITTDRFLKALSQFQLMCVSSDSKYDKYKRNEGMSLNADEMAGLYLFQQKCSSCHAGELFTDFSFRNNGLAVKSPIDKGRMRITLLVEDSLKFKVPTLRNIQFTGPYMHDGRFTTLEQVLEHYNSGIVQSPTLDPIFQTIIPAGIRLDSTQKQQIISFLNTLSDQQFLHNSDLSEF